MVDSAHPQTGATAHGGYEEADVNFRALLIFVAVLAAMVVATWLVVSLTFHHLAKVAGAQDHKMLAHEVVPSVAASRTYFPDPREQVSPPADLSALRAREDAVLQSYGWIDQNAGIVRLSIDRAMALIAERGLPRADTNAPGPSSLQLQQQRPLQTEPPRNNEGGPR
jgi:hypothetical protein